MVNNIPSLLRGREEGKQSTFATRVIKSGDLETKLNLNELQSYFLWQCGLDLLKTGLIECDVLQTKLLGN